MCLKVAQLLDTVRNLSVCCYMLTLNHCGRQSAASHQLYCMVQYSSIHCFAAVL